MPKTLEEVQKLVTQNSIPENIFLPFKIVINYEMAGNVTTDIYIYFILVRYILNGSLITHKFITQEISKIF